MKPPSSVTSWGEFHSGNERRDRALQRYTSADLKGWKSGSASCRAKDCEARSHGVRKNRAFSQW